MGKEKINFLQNNRQKKGKIQKNQRTTQNKIEEEGEKFGKKKNYKLYQKNNHN